VKPSKYRNVRCEIGGEKFDSKHEADDWLELKARESAGEISDLQRQVEFNLKTPVYDRHGDMVGAAIVASYLADFVFTEGGRRVVQDSKGGKATRTAVYKLKRRWLAIQDGIEIRES